MNTFDEIIQTKAYGDLTSSELEVIRELVSSEEEYNEMKSFYANIGQLAITEREEVSASVKTSLNSVFQAKHPGIHQNWSAPAEAVEEKKIVPLYNRTLFRVAALLVLSAGAATIWFALPEQQQTESKQTELTASSDASSFKETKEKEPASAEKKEFPINTGTAVSREFTAAAEAAPVDELAADKTTRELTINKEEVAYKWTSDTKSAEQSSVNYSVSPSASVTNYSFGNTQVAKEVSKEKGNNLTVAGMDADLNPDGFAKVYTKDAEAKRTATGISTTDLLTLIEPSF